MLTINVPEQEIYDEKSESFTTIKETTLQLEHSLLSISKWEAKWHKPFLEDLNKRTPEETFDYIKCMTITPNVNDKVYALLTEPDIKAITDYINDPMTATWFSDEKTASGASKKHEIITSEVIYYMMIAQNVPFECQKWHINRLLTLIKVCAIKNEQAYGKNKNKMPKGDILRNNYALNAQRRARLGTRG